MSQESQKPPAHPTPGTSVDTPLPLGLDRTAVLGDYRLAYRSRQASLLGRREVLTGKAKFGIFGDGKEVAQVAMAHSFRPGDFRSGYYRDQTLILALGLVTLEEFFAQLYADADASREPNSGGRSMSAHFASRLLDANGRFKDLTTAAQTSSDVSPTGSQMPRLVGLAQASKLYREIPGLIEACPGFSRHGDEVAWGTIGNASCAEGMFWESINAAGVLGVPVLVSIWDDGFGISVPNHLQVTKSNVGELLEGFRRRPGTAAGYDLHRVRGWDYPALCETYAVAAAAARHEHTPQIVHVVEMTQPQGHSTSGSHERYKSPERLAWEETCDPLRRMREWMIGAEIAVAANLDAIEAEETERVRAMRHAAWNAFRAPIENEREEACEKIVRLAAACHDRERIVDLATHLRRMPNAMHREVSAAVCEALIVSRAEPSPARTALAVWHEAHERQMEGCYSTHLWSVSQSALAVPEVPALYPDAAHATPAVNGSEILNACFDAALARLPNLVAFGEDLGQLGDVNQGFAGLQAKYGALRVADTGIREATILGQAIGLALRGLRPIAEIQYLDYILYCLQLLSDDLATLRWRTAGGQKAPVILRTRGHRLEGIWHSGSPMAGVLNLVRGIHLCVPRNMTQAAGMYNTLLRADEPAIVVEVLNGYRAKERLPANIGEFTVPLGVPEILRSGTDLTLVTYGACCKIALEAAALLAKAGISVEILDAQTLLPFDRSGRIVESLRKTNRLLIVDEDVPGGASAYILQRVLESAEGFYWLDGAPRTLCAKEHRPAYGSDGDYWSKPNRETIFRAAYDLMREAWPARFPAL
jgi:pyruvate/2-oxoglutarate/acetoin dehydrogenase E1 component/TPP-dependent pyruvate/acetoin dehydrogenase alpha subunit